MRGKQDFSETVVLGKARVYKELMFGNRPRNIQGMMECIISTREDDSEGVTVDGKMTKKGFVPWSGIVDDLGKYVSCLKMKYSIYAIYVTFQNIFSRE